MTDLTPEQLKAKIQNRQDEVRRWLLQDADHLPTLNVMGTVGTYAVYRWYRFGQVAAFNDGALLASDTDWARLKVEMRDWPAMLWVSILDNRFVLAEAKAVFGKLGVAQIAVTGPAKNTIEKRAWELRRLALSERGLLGVTELDVWRWLGPVGGQYPTPTVPE